MKNAQWKEEKPQHSDIEICDRAGNTRLSFFKLFIQILSEFMFIAKLVV